MCRRDETKAAYWVDSLANTTLGLGSSNRKHIDDPQGESRLNVVPKPLRPQVEKYYEDGDGAGASLA